MSAARPHLCLVDLGMGNLRSVERALRAAMGDDLARDIVVSGDPGAVRDAGLVVVPGQGAFGDCSLALQRHGGALARALTDHIERDGHFLGICLGLQALFEGSDEAPGRGGLGVFRGRVRRFQDGLRDADGARVKIPHMGWNQVSVSPAGAHRIDEGAWFYFVHSFHVVPDDRSLVAAESEHGERFVCAVAKGNLLGVQFHPEKSQRAGLTLLRRVLEAVP